MIAKAAAVAVLAASFTAWPVDATRPRPAPAQRLCTAAERTIFACSTGPLTVAVCAGRASAQYRAGRAGHLELASPPGSMGLSRADRGYSGGGESQVTFVSGRYAYTAYSSVVRTRFDGNGNDPSFRSGIVVRRGGKLVSGKRCVAPADAVLDSALARTLLPEGAFVEHH